MTAAPKGDLRLAALLCGVIGLYDVIYVAATLAGRHGLMYRVDVPLSDFLVFHAAARAFFEGKLGIIYDTAAFTDLQSALYGALLPDLKRREFHAAFAGIALPNPASVALHDAVGFAPLGVYREVGFKFGRWHDVGWWQRLL